MVHTVGTGSAYVVVYFVQCSQFPYFDDDGGRRPASEREEEEKNVRK